MIDLKPSVSFSVLTPPGPAAIAVIELKGTEARQIIEKVFRPVRGPGRIPVGEFRYGHWSGRLNPDEIGEDVLAVRTGLHRYEIHSHGGSASIARIVNDLTALHVSEHAVETVSEVLVEIPARLYLRATTEKTSLWLATQECEWQSFYESSLLAESRSLESETSAVLRRALEWEKFGKYLTIPRKIALFGLPNAGKSSLMNRLCGFRRSIVHETPGTTRDVVTMHTAIDGWPVELVDTAGLRSTGCEIEATGVQLAEDEIFSAELRILVVDFASAVDTRNSVELLRFSPDIVVLNKTDLAGRIGIGNPAITEFSSSAKYDSIPVSAVEGTNMDKLLQRISARLVPEHPEPQWPISLNAQMSDRIRQLLADRS